MANIIKVQIGNETINIDLSKLQSKSLKFDKDSCSIFNLYDKDGNSELDANELSKILKDLEKATGILKKDNTLDNEEGEKFFKKLNKNVTKNSKMTYNQFIELLGTLAGAITGGEDESGSFKREYPRENSNDDVHDYYKDSKGNTTHKKQTIFNLGVKYSEVTQYLTSRSEENPDGIDTKRTLFDETGTKTCEEILYNKYDEKIEIKSKKTTFNEIGGKNTEETVYKKDGIVKKVTFGLEGDIVSEDYIHNTFNNVAIDDIKQAIEGPLTNEKVQTVSKLGVLAIRDLSKPLYKNLQKELIPALMKRAAEIAQFLPDKKKELAELNKLIPQLETMEFNEQTLKKMNHLYYSVMLFGKDLSIANENDTINNEFYKSDKTYIKVFTGDTIQIIDKENNESVAMLDLSYTGPYYHLLELGKETSLKERIKDLPSEVLIDLSNDAKFSISDLALRLSKNTDGIYSLKNDKIFLVGGSMANFTLIHELGHAVDSVYNGTEGKYQSKTNEEFEKIFIAEQKKYAAQGYPVHKENSNGWLVPLKGQDIENNPEMKEFVRKYGSNYATKEPIEAFAEIYTLLMLGECGSMNILREFFPETIEAAKKIIAETRKLPVEQRTIQYKNSSQ